MLSEPTAIIVPIELWREIESEREAAYLLKSETMKQRLLAASQRKGGISLEAVVENLPRQTNPWVGDTFEWRLKARFAQPVNPARLVAWLAAPCIRSPLPFEPVFALPSKRYAVSEEVSSARWRTRQQRQFAAAMYPP